MHDLGRLMELLKQAGEEVPPDIARVGELTPYAVGTRYPGPSEPVDQQQYRDAIEIAETVVRWAKNRL